MKYSFGSILCALSRSKPKIMSAFMAQESRMNGEGTCPFTLWAGPRIVPDTAFNQLLGWSGLVPARKMPAVHDCRDDDEDAANGAAGAPPVMRGTYPRDFGRQRKDSGVVERPESLV